MTELERMLEELKRRNYSFSVQLKLSHAVEDFARHFGKSPISSIRRHSAVSARLNPGRQVRDRTPIVARIAALRFFFRQNAAAAEPAGRSSIPQTFEAIADGADQQGEAIYRSADGLFHYAILMTRTRQDFAAPSYANCASAISIARGWSFMFTRQREPRPRRASEPKPLETLRAATLRWKNSYVAISRAEAKPMRRPLTVKIVYSRSGKRAKRCRTARTDLARHTSGQSWAKSYRSKRSRNAE